MIKGQLGLKIDEGVCRRVENDVSRWKELPGEASIRGEGWHQMRWQEVKAEISRNKVFRPKGKQKTSWGSGYQKQVNQKASSFKVGSFKASQEVELRRLTRPICLQERAGP